MPTTDPPDDAQDKPLSPKHRAFVEAFVRLGVAWRAYHEAYPNATEATCQTNGPQLLRKAQISEAVAARRADLINLLGITPERIYLGVLAEAEDHGPGANGSSRVKAWELLGKAHGRGLWADRQELTSSDGVVFRLDLGGGDRIVTEDVDDDEPEMIDDDPDGE